MTNKEKQLTQVIEKGAELAEEGMEILRQYKDQANEKISGTYDNVKHKSAVVYEDVKNKSSHAQDVLTALVKDHPLQSVGLAVLAGVLIRSIFFRK